MGIEVIEDHDTGRSVFICNTTDTAFGPVFWVYEDESPWDFLVWHENLYPKTDIRSLPPAELVERVNSWRVESERAKAQEQSEERWEETRADYLNDLEKEERI